MDVECRCSGSVHDSNVLINGEMPATFQTLIPGSKKIPNYLIGDPAYSLAPFLHFHQLQQR